MICSSSSPPIRRRPGAGRGPRGFTMVELAAVILILAFLIALLLPALNGALKTAKNAAVGGEINQLAQALASFKAKYGDYPPSRILLIENGDYSVVNNASGSTPLGAGDITVAQLAQRSLAALRKFFPRVVFSTSGAVFPGPNYTRWYDFNGNGGPGPDGAYILQGHECLVFFLGGVPVQTATGFGTTGFGKDPTNPISNGLAVDPNYPNNDGTGTGPSPMYSNNRQAPLYEFVANRLVVDPYRLNPRIYPTAFNRQVYFPGYLDSLGNALPTGNTGDPMNYYAYFSAYGNGAYDPNDVNFTTLNSSGNVISVEWDVNYNPFGLQYNVAFPPINCSSYPPNPYTSSLTATTTTAAFLNAQSFQIISSGLDGLYGPGGQYLPDNTSESLPLDSSALLFTPPLDTGIRIRERDNVTNFHNGKLE